MFLLAMLYSISCEHGMKTEQQLYTPLSWAQIVESAMGGQFQINSQMAIYWKYKSSGPHDWI